METLGDIKAAVRARGYETDQDTHMTVFANDVQRDVLGDHRWRFMLDSAEVPAVIGTGPYALPAGVHHIESIRFVQLINDYTELEAANADELLEAAMASVTSVYLAGDVMMWAEVLPGVFQVFPAPTQGGVFTVRYIATAPELEDDADVPVIPEPYLDILTAGVSELCAARERQWDAADRFRAEKDKRIIAMKGQLGLKSRQTSSRVRPTGRYEN